MQQQDGNLRDDGRDHHTGGNGNPYGVSRTAMATDSVEESRGLPTFSTGSQLTDKLFKRMVRRLAGERQVANRSS